MNGLTVDKNDSVILYKSKNKSFLLEPGQKMHHLNISHDEIINLKYNTRYKNFVLLKKYPEQMIKTTKRQTQILFEADISYILYFLDIRTNSIVLECGTGSGVLTRLLSKRLCDGKLYTYERNTERYAELMNTFDSNVVVENVDLENAQLEDEFFDAIFLDLPAPKNVIKKCYKSLKKQSKICVFIPTVEQVLEVKNEMNQYFTDLKMYENIKKEIMPVRGELKKYIVAPNQYSHTGFLIFANKI